METKRLLILVGSHAGKLSHSLALCQRLAEQVVKTCRMKVEVEALTADQWLIGPCVSCNSCFRLGYCPQDEKDQMALLRQKLLECDALIVASPVYVLQVSSAMKLLIDRLGVWTHTMPLLGKPCCAVITTSRSVGETARYLEAVFSCMGCSVFPPIIKYRDVIPKNSPDPEQALNELAGRISDILDGKSSPPVTELMRAQFRLQSRSYRRLEKFLNIYPYFRDSTQEFLIWKAQGYMPFDTVEEALAMLRTGRE